MIGFPEDDEIEKLQHEYAQAEDGYDHLKSELGFMDDRRHQLRKQIELKTMDPVVKTLVQTARNEGHAVGANEALTNRIKFLEKRIEVRDDAIKRLREENDAHSDYDEWVESSAEWEQKYKNLLKSRNRRR